MVSPWLIRAAPSPISSQGFGARADRARTQGSETLEIGQDLKGDAFLDTGDRFGQSAGTGRFPRGPGKFGHGSCPMGQSPRQRPATHRPSPR
jgi:hypothetical protein